MKLPQFQAHADMEERHWWFLGRRHIVDTLLNELVAPGKTIVDVGCGTGGLTHFFSRKYACTGIDPSHDAITFAKQRFPKDRFVHGEISDHTELIRNADVVLLIEVLEHVEHDRDFVQRLLQEMKPGAVLIMMAPADMSLWSPHDDAFEHFRRYDTLEEFRRTWSGASVDELLVSFCNARLLPIIKMIRWLNALRGTSWGKGGTDITVPAWPVNALLHRIFSGEARRLLLALKRKTPGYHKGVSVISVLRKR